MSSSSPINKYASLLEVSDQDELKAIEKRKVSTSSTISSTSSVQVFLDTKIEDTSLGIEYAEKFVQGLKRAREDERISLPQFREAMSALDTYREPIEQEVIVATKDRQRRFNGRSTFV